MCDLFGGYVEEETRVKINEAYNKYDDETYDFTDCMKSMIKYVDENCKTNTNHSIILDHNKYIIQVLGSEALYLTKSTNSTFGYLFNINDGSVYILEYNKPQLNIECIMDLPFEIVLIMMSNSINNVKPVFLTN